MRAKEKQPSIDSSSPSQSSWEKVLANIALLRRHAQETHDTWQELLQHPEVREGNEAALRSALNIAISCADVVPGAGELASWGQMRSKYLKIFSSA